MARFDKATKGLMAKFNKPMDSPIIGYQTLRQLIGWLGVSVPFVVYLGNWVFFTHHVAACLVPSGNVPYSLSGYYYTHMRGVFTGTFWALGVFLVAYNGFEWIDQAITTVAGVSAIGIATFPTNPPVHLATDQTGPCGPRVPVQYVSSPHQTLIGIAHQICLIALILMLILMAWRFRTDRAGDETVTPRAKAIYAISAVGIAAGGLGAIIQNFLSGTAKAETPWLFWFEIVAILFFGISWFVKGEAYRPFTPEYFRQRRARPVETPGDIAVSDRHPPGG